MATSYESWECNQDLTVSNFIQTVKCKISRKWRNLPPVMLMDYPKQPRQCCWGKKEQLISLSKAFFQTCEHHAHNCFPVVDGFLNSHKTKTTCMVRLHWSKINYLL